MFLFVCLFKQYRQIWRKLTKIALHTKQSVFAAKMVVKQLFNRGHNDDFSYFRAGFKAWMYKIFSNMLDKTITVPKTKPQILF